MGSRRFFSLCAEHPAALSGYCRRELLNGAAFWARFLNLGAFSVEIEQQKRPEAQTAPRKGEMVPALPALGACRPFAAGARSLPAFAPPALGPAGLGRRPTAPAGAPNSLAAAPG